MSDDIFDLTLASMTRVERPILVNTLLTLGDRPIVAEAGRLKNAAWRTLNADLAVVYTDESGRSRKAGASQVETIRAYIKKVKAAWEEAYGEAFPYDVALTVGDDPTTVDIWRVR